MREVGILGRFLGVGAVNTLLGLGVIFVALRAGWGDYAANAGGYAAGLVASFSLNRRFTFQMATPAGLREGMRFLLTAAIAYVLNLCVLRLGMSFGLSGTPSIQVAAVTVYTAAFYVLFRTFVFR